MSAAELAALCADVAGGIFSLPVVGDLPRAAAPELVIRLPFEGAPRYSLEDGHGRDVHGDDRQRLLAWLLGVGPAVELMRNAYTIAKAFEQLDRERLAGDQPGPLDDGGAES